MVFVFLNIKTVLRKTLVPYGGIKNISMHKQFAVEL